MCLQRLLIVLLFVSTSSFADRVTLIYGDVLEGQVVRETDTTVTVRGPFGEQTLARSDIQEIQRDGSVATEAPGQDRAPAQPEEPPAPELPAAAPLGQFQPPVQPAIPPSVPSPPSPYELLKKNVEIQSRWKDLEIAYLQRAFIGGRRVETQFIGRSIPPHFFRSKLTTPIPASTEFPQGGEVEYDMYRAKSVLYQVVKSPGQPVQYVKLDQSRVEGLNPGDNPVESFKHGFAGAGTDEVLLQAIARNSRIAFQENTDGHDCWVLETTNSPELVEIQASQQAPQFQDVMRQQLSQLGTIRSWIGKEDMIQWRMENYAPTGDLIMSMRVLSAKPDRGLSPQDLRMKVPKGTEFIDVTDMVAGQFAQLVGGSPGIVPIPGPNEIMRAMTPPQPYESSVPQTGWPSQPPLVPQAVPGQGYPPGLPQQPQQGPPVWPQQPQLQSLPSPPASPQQPAVPAPYPGAIPGTFPVLPQQAPGANQQPTGVSAQPLAAVAPSPAQPVYYSQSPQPAYSAQPQASYYPQQPQASGYPVYPQQPIYSQQQAYPQPQFQQLPGNQPMTQQYVGQPGFQPQQQPSQQGGAVSGFFKRLFGGSGEQSQPGASFGGYTSSGNATVLVPVINGQPQLPTSAR